ncbi:hypothetical protein [Aeromonas veronii]|uniref:hypothetical protein n=1 Tax=Aeromonas veronii TaxID=654 RepID=UPI003D1E757B
MVSEQEMELYRQVRTSQDKYVYFLLAAVGAAIGFAMNQTQGMSLALSQIPLGISVLTWGLSFFFGCFHLKYVNATLFTNFEMFKIKNGNHPAVGSHPQLIEAAYQGASAAMEMNNGRANRYGQLQFILFIVGVIFYMSWHIIEMWLRGNT